ADRLHLRRDQPDRRRPLFRARSARAPAGCEAMSPPADPKAAAAVTIAEAPAVGARVAPVQTPLRRFLSEFAESKVAVGALMVLILVVLCAVFAPWIAPQNPYDLGQISILDGRLEPGSESMDGWTFW